MNNLKNNYFLHADDFGMNDAVSKSILNCIDNGSVNSVSVMFGGSDKYFNQIKNSKIKIKLHLNLTSNPKVYLEQNKQLFTNLSFFNLMFLKKENRSEVFKEIDLQIKEFQNIFQLDYLAIDGHHHIQAIPWINEYLSKQTNFKINELRVPKENIFLDKLSTLYNSRFYRNLFAVVLLRYLAYSNKSRIESPEFYGLLYSGIHNESTFFKALKRIDNKNIEFSLHPGLIEKKDKENMHWRDFEYYFNNYRKVDFEIAKSNILEKLNKI
tara:strand:+ start:28335 stop:29138 length:804 start_codon:yes stop_codon:yes gene_type:complete